MLELYAAHQHKATGKERELPRAAGMLTTGRVMAHVCTAQWSLGDGLLDVNWEGAPHCKCAEDKAKGNKKGSAIHTHGSKRGTTMCVFYGLYIYSSCYFFLLNSVGQ